VHDRAPGDAVCALLASTATPSGKRCRHQGAAVPKGITVTAAAALPETPPPYVERGDDRRLRDGQTLLVHGGGSGIGTHAMEVAAQW
jgi:NADPH:quinone reductase-like Zn-dependent oxidoreductase